MKAIAITRAATDGNNIEFLQEIDLPMPVATGHDLLVEVKAISVNPVDTKVREGFNADVPRVLGWDAVIHCIDPDNIPSQRLAQKLGSYNQGPTRLPPPFETATVDKWGQSRDDWRVNRERLPA